MFGAFSTLLLVAGLACTSAFAASQAVAAEDLKLVIGEHTGNATIVALQNANTDHALMAFRREADDAAEYCVRNASRDKDGDVDSDNVAKCVKDDLAQAAGKITLREADCSRAELVLEFGSFALVDFHKDAAQKSVLTNWRNMKSGQAAGNCSACGTATIIDTYQKLCPMEFRKKFDGYEVD